MFDKFSEECGVFGIFGHPEAANLTYLGLYALQHRGQESAGIAASDGAQIRASARRWATSTRRSTTTTLAKLPGHIADRARALFDGGREPARQRPADRHRQRARPDWRSATTATWSTPARLRDALVRRRRDLPDATPTPRSSCTCSRGRGRLDVEAAIVDAVSQVRGRLFLRADDEGPADRACAIRTASGRWRSAGSVTPG